VGGWRGGRGSWGGGGFWSFALVDVIGMVLVMVDFAIDGMFVVRVVSVLLGFMATLRFMFMFVSRFGLLIRGGIFSENGLNGERSDQS